MPTDIMSTLHTDYVIPYLPAPTDGQTMPATGYPLLSTILNATPTSFETSVRYSTPSTTSVGYPTPGTTSATYLSPGATSPSVTSTLSSVSNVGQSSSRSQYPTFPTYVTTFVTSMSPSTNGLPASPTSSATSATTTNLGLYNPNVNYGSEYHNLSRTQLNLIIAAPFVVMFVAACFLVWYRRREQKRQVKIRAAAEAAEGGPIQVTVVNDQRPGPQGWRDQALHGNPANRFMHR